MDEDGKREKMRKKLKLTKGDRDHFKNRYEHRERKEKRKKEKHRSEKTNISTPNLGTKPKPESTAFSRLSGEDHTIISGEGEKARKQGSGDGDSRYMKERIVKRELTPELARISALTEGPPKSKYDCKRSWFSRTPNCQHSHRSVDLNSTCSSSQGNPPHLEREDLSSSFRKQSTPPSLERADVSKLRAALKAYCDERRPRDDVDLEPPVLEPLDPVAYYYDSDGNKVWICPTCGGQDDGSPMIGCDECDAWYHWVCVGMNTAPDETEDWYCRHCIAKRRERMRGRNKFVKKKPTS